MNANSLEAFACGTPIVITDVGGAREVATSPDAGRTVAREPSAFAAAIGELLETPSADEAVRAAAERFTWPANAVALADHLTALVEGAGSARRRA